MNPSRDDRLSQIVTGWTTLNQAHGAPPEVASEAQRRVLQRYGGAVYRYLLGAIRDVDLADELYQEFALRFVRGDFHRASPEKGRFREFLKTTLFHLVIDVQRRRQRQMQPLPDDIPEPTTGSIDGGPDEEQRFRDAWRDQLLTRSWESLQSLETETGRPIYRILRFRVDHPQMSSAEIAREFSQQLSKKVSPSWVRKWLLIARHEFAKKLISEVSESLENAQPEELEQELIDLGVVEYCRPNLTDDH